jgi:hypothetical protein
MLKAPLPGCTVGFNLSIATMVLNLLTGFSRRLYRPSTSQTDSKRFENMLVSFFPWKEMMLNRNLTENPNCLVPESNKGAELLYNAVRNPLTHELGIKGKEEIHIVKERSFTDEDIVKLEDSKTLPAWASPAVFQLVVGNTHSEWRLSIGGLYWGTHRLLHKLLSDVEHASKAEKRLKEIIKRPKD